MTISPYRIVSLNGREAMFVNRTSTMAVIGIVLENLILEHNLSVTMYAGFRRFSNFVKQQGRYERLAKVCQHIYVCGVVDVMPPDISNITYIPLTEDMDAAHERFMIIDSPDFYTALLTRETTFSLAMPSKEQRFKGIWTYDPSLINQAVLLTTQMFSMPYQPIVGRNIEAQCTYLMHIHSKLSTHQSHPDREQAFLLHRSAMMRSSLAASEQPIMLLDQEKHVLAASQTTCTILGEDMAHVLGMPLHQCGSGIFAQRDPTEIKAPLMALLSVTDKELLAATSRAITDAKEQTIGWLVMLKHHINQQYTRSPRRTLPIAQVLQQYSKPLQEQIDELAAQFYMPDSLHDGLLRAQQQLTTLNAQIERLNVLQEVEAQGEINKQAVDVRELIRPIYNEHCMLARRQRIMLRLELPDGLPRVWCDPAQVQLALRELLNNIWQHATGCTAARIQVSLEYGYVHLSVQDNGAGLPADAQTQPVRAVGPGTSLYERENGRPGGLGLSIARAVARAHHGHFQLENNEGKGCSVTLMLPALR